MRRLHPTQPTSHALPGIPGATSLYFVGSRGGRLQAGRHHTLEARRHALDGPRRQCHPRSTLLSPQRTLRGLLGTPRGAEGRMTLSTFMSHTRPKQASGAAYSRRGIWHRSNRPGMTKAYPNAWFVPHWTSLYDLWCRANPPEQVSDQLTLWSM